MKRLLFVALALAHVASAGCAPRVATPVAATAAPSPRVARVVHVIDGDTLVTAGDEHVRMLGIDTAEMRDPSPVLRDLAVRASAELSRRVLGREVTLLPADEPLDRYGRTLAYVELDESGRRVDVGAELIAAGLARSYPTRHPRLKQYLGLERAARGAALGLFAPDARQAAATSVDLVLTPSQAKQHVGSLARVEGRLARAVKSEKAVFLFIQGGGVELKAVSFRVDLFPDDLLKSWEGCDVSATGRLKTYRGETELVVEGPDRLDVTEPVHAAN